jgi:hypothetical protein
MLPQINNSDIYTCIYIDPICVYTTYLFACVINEDVSDPYQCPGKITGYCALRR